VPEFPAALTAFFVHYENIFHFDPVPHGAFTRRGRDRKFIQQNQIDRRFSFRLVQRDLEWANLRFWELVVHIPAIDELPHELLEGVEI
jgi:hypothetical protein